MLRFLQLSLVLALFVSVSGCDNNGENDAPEVIAPDLFEVDTDFFSTPSAKNEAKTHFVASAVRVWPVSIVVSASLILPAAVTKAALQDTPEFSDGAYRWESSVAYNSTTATFGLHAVPAGSGHDWTALISFHDPNTQTDIDDFELFTAQTSNGGTEGNWQLFVPTIDQWDSHVLNAQFSRVDADHKTIVFSIPPTASANGGDSVTYVEDGDERRFVWVQLEQDLTHTVEWNAATGAGSITATNYNGGAKACWDENQDDVAC